MRGSATAALERVLRSLALTCLLLGLAVYAARGWNAWRAAGIAPGVVETSGCEEESFHAIHRAIHGSPVYYASTQMPFGSAYFNWLFYDGYQAALAPLVALSGDTVIPRAARLLSAIGGILGMGTLIWLVWRVLPETRLVGAALATGVFAGPLVGWWAHTARPDIWGLTLDAAAAVLLLTQHRTHPRRALVGVIVLCFAAWSLKPTNFSTLVTAVAFLTLHRRLGAALVLLAGSGVLWALTFWLMVPEYREILSAKAGSSTFMLAHGFTNLGDAAAKSLPLLALATGLLADARFKLPPAEQPLARDCAVFGVLGLLVSTPLAFALSCKIGAYSNYYFPSLLMVALAGIGLLATRRSAPVLLVVLGLLSLVQVAILGGWIGRLDLRPAARELAIRWDSWRDMPEPRFAADLRLNLPWLNPRSPPLVLAYNYPHERNAGLRFEEGGVGGLIARGWFASLMLPVGTDSYDGADLRHYVPVTSVPGMTVYQRKDAVSK